MHFFSAGHSLSLQCGRWNVLTFYFIPFYFLLTSFSLFTYCRSQVSDWDQDVKAALQSAALILSSALKRKKKKWLSPISFVKGPLRNERCPQHPPPCFFSSQGHMSSCCLAGCLDQEEEGEEEGCIQVHDVISDQWAAPPASKAAQLNMLKPAQRAWRLPQRQRVVRSNLVRCDT